MVVNVLPSYVLFVLAITGMGNTEKGPGITICELGMLREKLTGRLETLGPGKAVRGLKLGL